MDIKIGQSQALSGMNSQNMEIQHANTQKSLQKENKMQDSNYLRNSKEIDPKKVNEAINDLNKKLNMLNSQLKIEIDDETGIQVVKIVDKDTKEVIRQIPPETILKIAKYLDEITGLIFSGKA